MMKFFRFIAALIIGSVSLTLIFSVFPPFILIGLGGLWATWAIFNWKDDQ